MEPLIEPARSNGLVAFELPSAEGQPSVKCISLVDFVVAIKMTEAHGKGEEKSDEKLRKAATKWHPVATSVPEYQYLLSLMKLNVKTIHDFLKTIDGFLPPVSPIPEIASIFPPASATQPPSESSGCEEPVITIEILKECGFPDPRAINQLDQEFTAHCRSVEEAMDAVGHPLLPRPHSQLRESGVSCRPQGRSLNKGVGRLESRFQRL